MVCNQPGSLARSLAPFSLSFRLVCSRPLVVTRKREQQPCSPLPFDGWPLAAAGPTTRSPEGHAPRRSGDLGARLPARRCIKTSCVCVSNLIEPMARILCWIHVGLGSACVRSFLLEFPIANRLCSIIDKLELGLARHTHEQACNLIVCLFINKQWDSLPRNSTELTGSP